MLLVALGGIRSCLIFLLLCRVASTLAAAPDDYEGKTILLIAFDPRMQPMPASELADILPLKMGKPLRMSDVRAAVERLYATGRYADISIDAEARDAGVVIRILTKSNWFVGRVSVEGVSAPPSRDLLANAAKLDLGNPFHPADTATAVEGVMHALRDNGFFEARVEPRFTYEPRTQQVHISFVTAPGRRDRYGVPVVTGDPRRPVENIIRSTRWKGWFGWRPVSANRTQRGLERIRRSYQNKNRLMAQVALQNLSHVPETGRAVAALDVKAGPIVEVRTVGAKLSRGQLRRLVPVYEERSVDRDLLVEGARNIAGYFQTRGYFEAQVAFEAAPPKDGRQSIVYRVARGRKQKLVRLQIRGNRFFDEQTIRERLFTTPASYQFRRGRYNQDLLKRDMESIEDLYKSNGFRDVAVTSEVKHDEAGKAGNVAVSIDVNEGPQWLVAGLEILGVSKEDDEAVRALVQSQPGQAFSEANVATDRDSILGYYYNGGYPSASFEWSFRPSSRPHEVELRYAVTEGPRQKVREVLVSEPKGTRPQLVNRQILLNPGDPISQAKILETQRRLYDLGIFAKVDTAIQNPDGDEPYKYVLFQLEESHKYSLTTGLGAEIARIGGNQASLESPAGEAGFSPRVSFDLSRLNFLGRAHTVSFRGRLSSLQQRGLVSYTAPQFQGKPNLDFSVIGLFDSSRDVRTYSARRWEGSVQISHRWTRSRTLFYRFAYRRVSVDQNTLKIRPELIPLLSQPVRVGIPSVSYVDDRRDDPTDTRRGTYNSLDAGTASRIFGGEADFSRVLAKNSTYHPVGAKLVVARSFSFGWLHTLRQNSSLPADPQDIPLPERFLAGGASTLRAFPANQAGPRDPVTGFPLGGKALLLFNTELRFPLLGENIGGVLFHDAGNVYSRLSDLSFRVHQRSISDFDYMVHAVGLGIRYRTPIGPVRLDLAFGPNSPRFVGCRGTQEQLLFGQCDPTQQRINRFQFHFSLGQTF